MGLGYGGTASHCFGGGITGQALSHAWSMGEDSLNKHSGSSTNLITELVKLSTTTNNQAIKEIKEEEIKEEEMKEEETSINKIPKYFSFKQCYPNHDEDEQEVTIKIASVQYIEEMCENNKRFKTVGKLFKIMLNDGNTYFMVDSDTANNLKDILYSL